MSECARSSPPALNTSATASRRRWTGWSQLIGATFPASTLGGDTIGYHWVDDDHLALYLIDVTGHGLDAALLSVSIANVIRAGALPGADMRQPDQVLAKLNDAFQGEQHGERFFTIWYGVYQCVSRTMTWAGGGHPPSIVLLCGEPHPLLLPSGGLIMGVLRGVDFPARSCRIPAAARLLIFSDGVFEIFRDGHAVWNLDACIAYLASLGERQGGLIDEVLDHVYQLADRLAWTTTSPSSRLSSIENP